MISRQLSMRWNWIFTVPIIADLFIRLMNNIRPIGNTQIMYYGKTV
jgi:hypothetical protein